MAIEKVKEYFRQYEMEFRIPGIIRIQCYGRTGGGSFALRALQDCKNFIVSGARYADSDRDGGRCKD